MSKRDIKLDNYNITKNRFRELKYFCLQYTEWQDKLKYSADCLKSQIITGMPQGGSRTANTTENLALNRIEIEAKCKIIEQTAMEVDPCLYQYIIKGTTRDVSYNYLRTVMNMPCGHNAWYRVRRKFYYLLDKKKIG